MAEADQRDLLPRVTVPTLLIWGERDARSPLTVAHQFDEAIPDTELVVIEGAGHLSNLEQPERVNQAVRRSVAPTRRRRVIGPVTTCEALPSSEPILALLHTSSRRGSLALRGRRTTRVASSTEIGLSRQGLDGVGTDVLEELEATSSVGRRPPGPLGRRTCPRSSGSAGASSPWAGELQ